MPRPMGQGGTTEKAKDLKGTLKKLLHYFFFFFFQMFCIVIFAICGTAFTIV